MTTDTLTLADFVLARVGEDEVAAKHVPDWHCTNSARGEGWGSRGDCPRCGHYIFDGTEVVTDMWACDDPDAGYEFA